MGLSTRSTLTRVRVFVTLVATVLFAPTLVAAAPTISLNITTVTPGGTVTATIANGPGNPTDWIGLYAAGAPDASVLDWKYLNGTRTAPATGLTSAIVTFALPLTAGSYDLRMFTSGYTRLATSAVITVQSIPALSSNPTSAPPSGTVSVTVFNGPGSATDWIGLFRAGTPDASVLDWKYLNGTRTAPATGLASATVTFTMPVTAGSYDFRMFRSDYSRLATSDIISVQPIPALTVSQTTVNLGANVTATVANGPGNASDWIGLYAMGTPDASVLDWKYLNGTRTAPATGLTSATVTFTMPVAAGSYELRMFRSDYSRLATSDMIRVQPIATLSANPTSVNPSATVTATVANGPGNTSDWIGLYAMGAPDASMLDWKYLNGTRTEPTTGLTSASVPFTMPTTTGSYNLRMFRSDYSRLATSQMITVVGDTTNPSVSITAPAANANLSGTVSVTATASDNVGVAGVQFKLDGVNLGNEITTAPYSLAWNTDGRPDLVFGVTKVAVGPMTISAGTGFTTRAAVSCSGCTGQDMVTEDKVQVSPGQTAATFTFSLAAHYLAQMAAFKAVTTPTYVQGNSATTNTGTSTIAQAFGANATAGNLIVVAVAWQGSTTVTISDSRSNTYAMATSLFDAVNSQTVAIFYAANVMSGATTVTATFAGTAPTIQRLAIHEYSGIATTSPLDVTATNIADGTTTANSITSGLATTTVIAPTPNGSHTLTAQARDAAGNTATSAAVPVTVGDVTPPTISGVTASAITPSGATFTWTTNELSDSEVEYGPTTAYGGFSTLDVNRVTAHTMNLSGLAASTLYHYRVRSRDAAGNLGVSADGTFTTLEGTPPTVSITAPAQGATVSGTVNVTANATDNVGVAGVQFQLDGAALGAEDTSAPYAIAWNTTTASEGVKTLTAVARDAAGNRVTSVAITVTVANLIGQVTLAWNPNTEPDLSGYKVHVGTASGVYVSVINVGNVTTYTVTGLSVGTTYFFAVTAYNQSAAESGFSNEVSKLIP